MFKVPRSLIGAKKKRESFPKNQGPSIVQGVFARPEHEVLEGCLLLPLLLLLRYAQFSRFLGDHLENGTAQKMIYSLRDSSRYEDQS